MRPSRRLASRVVAVAAAATCGLLLLQPAGPAHAHPLGNFSINHSHNLTIGTDGVVDDAVVDFAEIPMAQSKRELDPDGDGASSATELAAHAAAGCAELVGSIEATVGGDTLALAVVDSSFTIVPGQAGLPTGRLECRFEGAAVVSSRVRLEFDDHYEPDRVGWREINARGDGVKLIDSPVPTVSGTDRLHDYPVDLLGSTLNVRSLSVDVEPGTASGTDASAPAPVGVDRTQPSWTRGGPFASLFQRFSDRFDALVGRQDLTVSVGLLAVALAMLLGASHALLPGHGKTVMAAYIAGRQGTSRDAVVVGATVTVTHTGGVLLLGLALTVSSSLAGETVLGWLGVVSGLLIGAVGASLLLGAGHARTRGHHHGFGSHHHGHTHAFGQHDHGHHGHSHGDGGHAHGEDGHGHAHGDGHDHDLHGSSTQLVVSSDGALLVRSPQRTLLEAATFAPAERTPIDLFAPEAEHPPAPSTTAPVRVSRRGLVGMGVAGGLVPSPSALVVLLSAIALGRTAFGILLVVGYGLGMATTLTLAGLLLVRVRDRLQRRASWRRGGEAARRWTLITPYLTATLVLVVGVGIAIRGLGAV